jgi:hypothetical protein
MMQKFKFPILILLLSFFPAFSQTDIIRSGDFSDFTQWNLDPWSGSCTSFVSNGELTVQITDPGAETWSIQLTQKEVRLDSGKVYRFSFEAAADMERTIEAAVGRDGGDYYAWSGRDTVTLNTVKQSFEYVFSMRTTGDSSARVEFNLGKYMGNIIISNVQLIELPGPLLSITSPSPGALVYVGNPETVSWVCLGDNDPLTIELSVDNGLSWKLIADSVPNTGSYTWIPEKTYSPWCILRLKSTSDETLTAQTEMPFERAASTQLVFNGSFSISDSGWSLEVKEGLNASGEVTEDGYYKTVIETAGSEAGDIRLTQGGIVLLEETVYELSFTAYSESERKISVSLNPDGESNENLLDNSSSEIELNSLPAKYRIEFTIGDQSYTNAHLRFNCGLDDKGVFLDEIVIMRKIYSKARPLSRTVKAPGTANMKVMTFTDKGIRSGYSGKILDLMGRSLSKNARSAVYSGRIRLSPGLYISSGQKTEKQ